MLPKATLAVAKPSGNDFLAPKKHEARSASFQRYSRVGETQANP